MPDSPNFEKHLQTGIAAVIVGLVVWVGSSINGQGEIIVRLDERVGNLQKVIEDVTKRLDEATKDRYTASEARSHRDIMIGRVNTMETRLDQLEQKFLIWRAESGRSE